MRTRQALWHGRWEALTLSRDELCFPGEFWARCLSPFVPLVYET